MKQVFICVLCLLCASCSGNIGTWNGDNSQGNGNGTEQENQESGQPQETTPSNSGVVIEDEITSEDNIDSTSFDGSISIIFNGDDATVSGSVKKVTVEKNGARVIATNSGDKKIKYILSGSSSDGSFKVYGSKKQAIVLDGLSLTNTKGSAINNQCKKRTFFVIQGVNNISDGNVDSNGDYPEETEEEDMKAAIFSEGQLIFSGAGSLSVKAIGKAGITSDDYIRFMTGSDVSVNSAKGHGVRGKDAIIVSGGTINVSLESTATGKKCFSTDSLMYIGGGKTTLTNKASAGLVDSELTGAAGIKADGLFVIQGGELSITASGKGCKCISGDKDAYFEGGKVTAKATGANYGSSHTDGRFYDTDNSVTSKAIKFDGNLEISSSEIIAECAKHEAIEAKGTIYISGGSINATSSDDAINSGSTMTIAGGVVIACSTGNDGLDSNGDLIIKGGTVYAVGSGTPEVAIDANTEEGHRFYLQSGNIIAIGGIENNSSVSQPIVSTSWSRNLTYSLCDNDNAIFSFKAPSSGGSGLYLSSPSLVKGNTYSLKTSATITGATSYFDGILSIGGTATGGSSTKVTATTYTSGGGNNPGGGQWGPGGRGW